MSNNRFKVLVIEDEANIRSFVETILSENGYQVITADNYSRGKMMFSSYVPDIVILDLGLPDFDGIDLIGELRESFSTPIIVLSARTDEREKVKALDLGANDYITKPFGTEELLARVRASLRNVHKGSDNSVSNGIFKSKDLIIDYNKRIVSINGVEIKLTQTEYNIIVYLADNVGKVVTYSAIIKSIWGVADEGAIKKLQVNMANIRKKFGSKPGDNKYIINELGVGYRMLSEE